MPTAKNFTLLLALVLGASACTGEVGAPGGGGDGTGTDPGGGGDQSKDVSGTYALRSKFDLATSMPGKVGEVVNTIIAATDGADDPSNWLIEQVVNALPPGNIRDLVDGSRLAIAGFLNDQLLSYAPDFVGTLVQLGNDFSQMAKNFGTVETLEISGPVGAWTSIHTVTGCHFKIDATEHDVPFADYQLPNVAVPDVGITLSSTGYLGIAAHRVPLSYGKLLRIALDAVLIPMIDANAHNLGELLQHQVDCASVGTMVANQIGGFGADTVRDACNAGLVVAADYIYSKIVGIDSSALEFDLTGKAKTLDKNRDGNIDSFTTGTWTGHVSYAGTAAPLSTATFFGTRMNTGSTTGW